MATNAAPVYGKQYIRYAETWEAAVDNQNGDIGVVEIGELRAVSYATWAGPNVAAAPNAFTTPGSVTTIAGINQAYMPSAIAQPYTARQLTVATSGLLLIEQDTDPGAVFPTPPAPTPFTNANLNFPLAINEYGQAKLGGTPVTIDGTTPLIREIITIGGRNLALVSFA
jgi:hypothetical protein